MASDMASRLVVLVETEPLMARNVPPASIKGWRMATQLHAVELSDNEVAEQALCGISLDDTVVIHHLGWEQLRGQARCPECASSAENNAI